MRCVRSAPPGLALAAGLALAGLALAACAAPDEPAAPPPGMPVAPAPPLPAGVAADSLVEGEPGLRYSARVALPRLSGAAPGIAAVNAAIADSVRTFLDGLRPTEPPPPDAPATFVTEVEGGFEEVLLRDSLFSALLSLYAYTGGAHGNTTLFALTYDLATGQPVPLEALFRPGAPFADTLSARATAAVVGRYGEGALFDPAIPAEAGLFRLFTLGADSLAVHFPPYAVAPYAVGVIRVPFAYRDLAPLLDPAGPLAPLVAPDSAAVPSR